MQMAAVARYEHPGREFSINVDPTGAPQLRGCDSLGSPWQRAPDVCTRIGSILQIGSLSTSDWQLLPDMSAHIGSLLPKLKSLCKSNWGNAAPTLWHGGWNHAEALTSGVCRRRVRRGRRPIRGVNLTCGEGLRECALVTCHVWSGRLARKAVRPIHSLTPIPRRGRRCSKLEVGSMPRGPALRQGAPRECSRGCEG